MSDILNQPEPNPLQKLDELEHLKAKAKVMGITHSGNIGVEALRAKINAKMAGEPEPKDEPEAPNALTQGMDAATLLKEEAQTIADAVAAEEPVVVLSLRQYMIQEQMKLVRLRITNLDPKKKDLPGEIFTVANEHLGTVRKYVPFGEQTDDGYHVPWCIYEFMKTRKFISITTKKDRRTGAISVQNRDVAEFALEVLEPLTKEELRELAVAQIAAGSAES